MQTVDSIGSRLREVREELKKNQTEFAGLAGATRQTQSNYEKGERAPDAIYLAAIADAGADVQYILTGVRSAISNVPVSTRNEQSSGAKTKENSLAVSVAYGNWDAEEEILLERPSSEPNWDAKEPAQPTLGELFDRERMRTAIVCVEAGLRKRFAPAKKAEILLTCYDLLGQWEREDKAADFAKRLQAFLAAAFD